MTGTYNNNTIRADYGSRTAAYQNYSVETIEKSIIYIASKRAIDIAMATVALMIILPIFLIIALAIKLTDKGSVLFKQERVGKDGKTFVMYKFRTMVPNAEALKAALMAKNEMDGPMFKMKNDPRITKIGAFLRKTSLDELPQLINIIFGDMSFVGPRPNLPSEVAQFNTYQLQKTAVTPGLTCYWQVSGRNTIDFENWIELDLEYIRNRCFIEDIKLIFRTFKVMTGDDNAF